MDVTPLVARDRQVIQSYGAAGFRISGASYETPVFVFPDHVAPWDYRGDAPSLSADDFAALAAKADEIDVVLLGCGAGMTLLPDLQKALKAQNLSIETMDTGAACRTYNVLMAEGRRVVAALLPVKA